MQEFSDADVLGITEAMMLNTARGCLETMKIVKVDHRIGYWHLPFYILGATCLELFPKVLLLKKMRREGKTIEAMDTGLRNLSHHLERIYSKELIGSDFLSRANILDVKVVIQSGVYRYDFYRNNVEQPVYVFHPESMRYGLIAGNRSNLGYPAYQTDDLLDLCNSVFISTLN